MTDYFKLLAQPRLPWLDPDELKNKFMELTAQAHPDKFPHDTPEEHSLRTEKYALLNTAYQNLSSNRSRILHLIELISGKQVTDIQRIPPGYGELFMEMAQTLASADAFLQTAPQEDSPILKAKRFAESLTQIDKLTALQKKLFSLRSQIEEELKAMNSIPEKEIPLERLEELYRSLSYISRWDEQLREKLLLFSV